MLTHPLFHVPCASYRRAFCFSRHWAPDIFFNLGLRCLSLLFTKNKNPASLFFHNTSAYCSIYFKPMHKILPSVRHVLCLLFSIVYPILKKQLISINSSPVDSDDLVIETSTQGTTLMPPHSSCYPRLFGIGLGRDVSIDIC